MGFDSTIHLTDLLMAVVTLGVIPLVRLLVRTLRALQASVVELTWLVVGTKERPGLVGDLADLKKETLRHRTWLIEMQAEAGLKRDDRS